MPENIEDSRRWLILQRKLAEHRIAEIFRTLRQHDIEPILIKGWAAGLKYTQPWERFFSDIDIAVNPKEFQKASDILGNKHIEVDLHAGMRHHDTLSWNDLYENSRLVTVEETAVRIPREEDHLRILCVHWLTDGGAFREKLLDIYYAVRNRSADFDWERCLSVVSVNRRRWIICTIGLAHQYYDLDIDDLPFAAEARKVPVWVKDALEKEWNSGVRLLPLNEFLQDRRMLWKQIKKRMPPNPIEAMVEMEGKIDSKRQIQYQAGSIARRFFPALKRIRETLRNFAQR
jgi:hypothetical protein